jgi:hypothetical protein
MKGLVWPLAIWLLATRRWRAAGLAVALAGGLTLAAFEGIGQGVDGIGEYARVVRILTDQLAPEGYTLYAFALELGASSLLAHIVTYAAGAAVLLACVLVSRHAGRDADRRGFALALLAALLLSPIVWPHYFVLVLVPLALRYPRVGWVWFVPLVTWIAPGTGNGAWWQSATMIVAMVATLLLTLRREPERPPSGEALAGGGALPSGRIGHLRAMGSGAR